MSIRINRKAGIWGVWAVAALLTGSNIWGASAGYCLRFDGTNGYVSVAHNSSLNAYPMTVSAWFRTTSTSAVAQSLASKYVDASGNGWALILQNGNLRGFYYRTFSNFAIDATSSSSVADGFWHYAALVIDANGGKLYLDGNVVGSGTWAGPQGAPTSTEPLQIGRYYTYPSRILGDIDEVRIWNRALGNGELNYSKHRQIAGNTDGLVALWHFDEGANSTSADATGNGNTANLISNPVWVASSAPLVFNQAAGTALKLDGVNTNQYVTVPHTVALNAYPFSVTAWVRTSRVSSLFDAIVSKYTSAGYDGYALAVYQGRLRSFYFRNPSNYVFPSTPDGGGMDGGPIADGNWHHVAFVVGPFSGSLYVDGINVTNQLWTGTAGPPTTNGLPLLIGRYTTINPSFTNTFSGQMDEVTLWTRALSTTDIQSMMNLPLVGNETGLTAYWRFDEAGGSTAGDSTGHGHDGTVINSPQWLSSTAFLGDRTSAIHTTIANLAWSRLFAVATIPAQRGFAANAPMWVRRLDDFGAPSSNSAVVVTLQSALQSTLAGPLPLINNSTQLSLTLGPYNAAIPQAVTGGIQTSRLLDVEPQPGTQIDSVNDTVQLSVANFYSANGGPVVPVETATLSPVQVLHFDGSLYFGSIQTTFSSLLNTPTRGALSGGGISTLLSVNNNSGTVVGHPSLHYGAGNFLNAVLMSNGDAIAGPGSRVTLTGTETNCVQNLCYTASSLSLSNDAFFANLTLQLPAGFSVCTNFSSSNRLTVGQLTFSNVTMTASFAPVASTLTKNGSLCAVEETKPFWIQTPSLNWLPGAGQLVIPSPTAFLFVRQEDDDLLTASAPTLTDPNTAYRVSNDGYFRNVSMVGGSQVAVTADANGVAQMSAQATLNPPELRPHFPYSGNGPGVQIPTSSGGLLAIQAGQVDTVNSYLPVSGAVPGIYARDCSDTNCSATTIGPANLAFAPNNSQLTFTLDGGLLAYGSVPPTNLTWGYAGNDDYAQRTSDVQVGAYAMSGTSLRYDQSALTTSQLPSVLLLSGFGDDSNPAYLERPGQSAYSDGLANYAGLNFRAPDQGRSYVAHQDTGWYPLTGRSKYYARLGGISGIHESASFPSSMVLYGYPFTFISYRLSFLDSDNWESRTDGALSLPVPAGFLQEFSRMKFVCRGDLDSAQVPPYSGTKHMVYWDANITPQSIEFHPSADDACGTSDRFLVLGVETQLPFIPHGLHAALGFKNNGNLVTSADNVAGCDSRFAVPGHLTLQGPGASSFSLETGGDGYFNNWETPGRPDNGFYNLAGKIRVPFFSDVKAHLHVTPTGPSTAQIDIMGGWPAADSDAADRGWDVGKNNYFNTAKFDRNADGWPQGISLSAYRQAQTEQYHPRAQRNWIQVAKFDYPLQWNTVLREFEGFSDAKVILPVIDVNSRLKELSPGKVDFDFAQDITVQLPRLKVLDFANDALNELNAPIMSVSNAIYQAFLGALDSSGLAQGFRSMQGTLREDASGFFRPVLQPQLDPVAAQLRALLAEMQRTNASGVLTSVVGLVTSPGIGLQGAIQGINGAAGQANTVVGQLNQTLLDVDNTLNLFLRVLEKDPGDPNHPRHVVRIIIQKLVQDQGPALGIVANLGDDVVNGLLQDLEPTLARIESELTDLRAQFNQLRFGLAGGTGDFSAAVNGALNDGLALQNYANAAGAAVSNLLAVVAVNHPDYFTADPAAAQATIEERLTLAFLASALPGNYQRTFRQFMYDDNFVLDQLMDVLFDQINRSIRDGLGSQIVGSQDGVFQAMKGIGQMSQSLLSAKIRGSPTFEGDSLRRIHLDANVQMNLPDEMHFTAYMDIKELTSQSVPLDCIPAGAPAAEVTLGAKDVPLNWTGIPAFQPLTLTAEARWTLQNGNVLGVGGLFDIKGEAGFKGCTVKEIGATLAIGELENYFAAKAAGTIIIIGIPVDIQAGLFAGHACSLDPLRFIDPDVTQVLGDAAEFRGIYVQYGGGLSLSQILLGTSTCFLDVQAGVTTAAFYQDGPRSGKIGFRQKDSVDVSLLCVISGHVDFSLGATATFMPPSSYELDVIGSADVCGSLGECPFCVDGCKGITIKGIVKDGGIDYSIDY